MTQPQTKSNGSCCSCSREETTVYSSSKEGARYQHWHCDLCYSTLIGTKCRTEHSLTPHDLADAVWWIVDQLKPKEQKRGKNSTRKS